MQGVLTSYKIGNNKYGSYILGSSISKITIAITKRGLNETIESTIGEVQAFDDYSQLTDEEFSDRITEILHTSCFLSYVVLKSEQELEFILGDEGVIHEISHFMANVEGCNRKSLACLRDLVKKLQAKAIGFYDPV